MNDPIFKLRHSVGNRIRLFLKIKKVTKRNSTFEMVGCTPQELKSYLEYVHNDKNMIDHHDRWRFFNF